ncbi:unnamed protein product [Gongylonema pulchrum]|uniref:Uncharacterized protein n=1 Tax=Gongylonema pulchrum TaxID=637853 RepID=A0A183D2T1_9BILA|nr:unnamed protein product [Gongylonema pulchrum]
MENENAGAIYSTIDRTTPMPEHSGSFFYSEGPTNPTYECIDLESDSFSDPLYSKLENGVRSTRRYDYPIFAPALSRPVHTVAAAARITADEFYQSSSQIYAGVSEDPYSSITSHAGGETNYDLGYSRVNERTTGSSAPAENQNLEQLYTQVS